MQDINWDKLQEQYDEHLPYCPWIDDEEKPTKREKEEQKTDDEED